ncbi:MAG: GTP-binding protein [Mycetocola reblochoni]|uniref:Cobalamin biosynthesis protein CobW n=2 Tax=Mycetocola reblochoni TaxID=331618 RepID=A0A3L6ZKQ7_9MICO|nr:GTP-binding protein [Mycetocola reblochoni]RLP68566.1 cobalamin biosynthesis protein CobW [Mycetocola reblochoni]SJN41748.1 Putative metal chaperone, involved in Zn homeostasis, GTPase of COG0523 family [Mycetocola reblochoni REB411]
MTDRCLYVRADDLHSRLNDDRYLPLDDGSTHGPGVVAAAQRFVEAIETAPAIALTGWEELSTADLSITLALLSHLNPRALVKPYRADDPRTAAPTPASPADEHPDDEPHSSAPGWICCLNGEHEPWFHDRHVQTLLYRNMRPFHPERLLEVFDGPISSGRLGTVVRSAGFCQLATRTPRIGLWSHVGRMVTLDPTPFLSTDPKHPSGQEIVLTGIGIDGPGIVAALDGAVLTDEEFTAGPRRWQGYADPLTPWREPDAGENGDGEHGDGDSRE